MRTKLSALILAGSLLASGNAAADMEPWYTLWSLGSANLSYSDDTGEFLDFVGSRTQGSIDMLGFYWPLADKKTIVGGVISGAFDSATNSGVTFQVDQYLYAVSTLHFFGSEPGDGFFLRGDLGAANSSVTVSDSYTSASASSGSGTGYLVGAGFGVPVSSQSRLLISLVYSNKSIDSVDYTSTGLIISGLW